MGLGGKPEALGGGISAAPTFPQGNTERDTATVTVHLTHILYIKTLLFSAILDNLFVVKQLSIRKPSQQLF